MTNNDPRMKTSNEIDVRTKAILRLIAEIGEIIEIDPSFSFEDSGDMITDELEKWGYV